MNFCFRLKAGRVFVNKKKSFEKLVKSRKLKQTESKYRVRITISLYSTITTIKYSICKARISKSPPPRGKKASYWRTHPSVEWQDDSQSGSGGSTSCTVVRPVSPRVRPSATSRARCAMAPNRHLTGREVAALSP